VCASVTVAIGDDVEHLREKARPQLALYIGGMGARSRNFYNDLACRYGLEGPAAKIQDLYLAGHKDEAAAAVPDELIEGTTLIGPAGYVRERLAAYREAGVTLLTVRPAGPDPDPERLLGQLREWM
jgi:alkanesulfonate monooxygenase SsuD/methylene tetrahydromethanopterin reductase-like flavin-dependent oxidoreductase (luciferase family)